ncbi:MAG: tungstate ABC transporter substrate-binding protein WtpA [bacterium]|jgi:molybdate/tungstate transport system substrate-binding protein
MVNRNLSIVLAFLFQAAMALATSCPAPEKESPPPKQPQAAMPADELSGRLTIFHAGSLSVPLAEVSKAFEAKHPKVKVLAEAAGSRDTARKVSDLGQTCDIVACADYEVIDELLIPDHASFNIRFARNRIIIAYTDKSLRAQELTTTNWHELLLLDEVKFGRADPDRDPCGYRTLMVFQLAEKLYAKPGLADALTKKDGDKYIRPKETDLLALLESGEIDYLFIYYSVAVQHNLKYLDLPGEVNLGDVDRSQEYKSASVEVVGKSPGEFTTLYGAPIVYAVTIPKNSSNPRAAAAYLEFLLSPEGGAIIEKCGQPPISPAVCAQYEALPESLKPLCIAAE